MRVRDGLATARRFVAMLGRLERLERLGRLERLRRLERLEWLRRLERLGRLRWGGRRRRRWRGG
jgi:hypothetical protein